MKSQIEPAELMQRIRREARRHEKLAFPPSVPPDPTSTSQGTGRRPLPMFAGVCESLLAQIGHMLEGARGKTAVRKSVPKLLRALSRNQGGYNDIVLATLERLREANRLLINENVQLRLDVQSQADWIQSAERRLARIEAGFADAPDQDAP